MRDFIEVGRALDRHFAASKLSAGEEYRLRAWLEDELARPGHHRGAGHGITLAVALLASLVLWMLWPAPPSGLMSGSIIADSAELGTLPSPCSTAQHGAKLRMTGVCEHQLDDLGVRIETIEGAIVERAPLGVRMYEGRATFEVVSRTADEPFVVVVSHGRIEVIGTRFTVEQGGDGGSVELFEGRIRFRNRDGSLAELMPGDSLRWGSGMEVELGQREAQPGPASLDPEDREPAGHARRRARAEPAPHLEAPLGEAGEPWWISPTPVDQLLDDLGDGAPEPAKTYDRWSTSRAKDEELSYEQGLVLDLQDDRERACHHWRRHMFNYSPGPYARRAQERERAACKQPRGEEPW